MPLVLLMWKNLKLIQILRMTCLQTTTGLKVGAKQLDGKVSCSAVSSESYMSMAASYVGGPISGSPLLKDFDALTTTVQLRDVSLDGPKLSKIL